MLSPLAQPALVQNGLQPVWLLSRALLSRSPRAAVVLAAAASSGDGGAAPSYKKEHLVWEDGFGACASVVRRALARPGVVRRALARHGQRAHPRARSLGANERAPVLACLPLQIPPPCPIRPPCPHQALRGEPTRVLRARRRCEPEPRGVAARSARRAGLAAASAPPALPPPRVVVSLHSGWG